VTPYLRYQTEQAWKQDEARKKAWEAIGDEAGLLKMQDELRQKLLQMIGGLPTVKTDLHPVITGKIQMDGFVIEKLVFQSLPGVYVTALVYVPMIIRAGILESWCLQGMRPMGKFTIRR